MEWRSSVIKRICSKAKETFTQQATKMIKLSKERYRDAEVDETVRTPISYVDRAHADLRNILRVLLSCTDESYKIGKQFVK